MPEKTDREILGEMKAFAKKSFERAVLRLENSSSFEQKEEYERRALQAIKAYVAADAALKASINPV